jgi:hypothetical protein
MVGFHLTRARTLHAANGMAFLPQMAEGRFCKPRGLMYSAYIAGMPVQTYGMQSVSVEVGLPPVRLKRSADRRVQRRTCADRYTMLCLCCMTAPRVAAKSDGLLRGSVSLIG